MIDHLIRAESRSVWLTYAQDQGWIDEDDRPTPGTLIDELGPVVIEPAVIDMETMEVTTPAVMDDWHHVNVRLVEEGEPSVDLAGIQAVDVRGVSAVEKGLEPTRIQVLSAADIATPVRIWAGGMYFKEPVLPQQLPSQPKKKRKK